MKRVFFKLLTLKFEILASLNFNKNKNLVPLIGEEPYIEMLSWQFSNITKYIRVVGKMPDQHFIISCSPIQETKS